MSKAGSKGAGARTRARELMVQALYQKLIAGHSTAELLAQFHEQAAYRRVDQDYFDEAFPAISDSQDELEKTIDALIDRPLEQLDPVELAILADRRLRTRIPPGRPIPGRSSTSASTSRKRFGFHRRSQVRQRLPRRRRPLSAGNRDPLRRNGVRDERAVDEFDLNRPLLRSSA